MDCSGILIFLGVIFIIVVLVVVLVIHSERGGYYPFKKLKKKDRDKFYK